MQLRKTLGTCALGYLLLGSSGCGAPENAFIMSQMHLITSAEEGPSGLTCSDVSRGGGSSALGSSADDFWMTEKSSESGLSVEIGSLGQTLESRFYDRAFIAAHALDRFVVTTASGDQYDFVYWGGDHCESCPPPPSDLPPGDPFGCGSSQEPAAAGL